MDVMYEKIKELGSKMDELQQIVQELRQQTNLVNPISEAHHPAIKESSLDEMEMISAHSDLNMEHKDILVGGNSWQYHSYRYRQMGMTAEVEIRRLTAQLTAAYNRIAALEEQLLIRNQKNVEKKLIK